MGTPYREKDGNETPGESFLYDKFKNLLADDYLFWHNQYPQSRSCEIDFVILQPTLGIWVVEVKDWVIDQIAKADSHDVEIRKKGFFGGITKARTPLTQADENRFSLIRDLERFSVLKHADGRHQGKLSVPSHSLAILTNITRAELEEKGLSELFPVGRVWTKDFVRDPDGDQTAWEKALADARQVRFQCDLAGAALHAVKAAIGVAVVVPVAAKPETTVATLDDHQSRLVEYGVDKQVMIEGPAGSGKSLVLLNRAIHIQRTHPDWSIGILCFNALMANYLRTLMNNRIDKDVLNAHIDIYDVYDWVRKLGLPNYTDGLGNNAELTDALKRSNWTVEHHYDALLVDEGQDSTETMMKLYRAILRTNGSFTFFYDRRQTLYPGSAVNLIEQCGFQIDKQQNLVRQQRSPLVLAALAYYEHCDGKDVDEAWKHAQATASKWFSIRQWIERGFAHIKAAVGLGKAPQADISAAILDALRLEPCKDPHEMTVRIADRIQSDIKQGQHHREIAVLVPSRNYGANAGAKVSEAIRERLIERNIPYTVVEKENPSEYLGSGTAVPVKDNRRNADLARDSVKIMTVHTSKGFDASHVYVAGFEGLDRRQDNQKPTTPDELGSPAQRGYVALTRAKQKCEVYFVTAKPNVHALEDVMRKVRENPAIPS